MNLREAQSHVADRLSALGFPFDDHGAQCEWCKRGLREGWLELTVVTDRLSHGATLDGIAHECGMSLLRVYHHLSRGSGMQTSEHDEWRLVYVGDEDAA
jgi:hypothetical protein